MRYLENARQDDGDDEAVDGDRLAENNGDQVLGLDAWGPHTATYDAHAGRVDASVDKTNDKHIYTKWINSRYNN